MRFVTANSVYDIDLTGRRLRRVSSHASAHNETAGPSPWRCYQQASPVQEGLPVVIVWDTDRCGDRLVLHTTVTSPVVAILN